MDKFKRTDRLWALALLLLVSGTIVSRCPELFSAPRFWAEEGEIYFAAAYRHGFWQALFLPHIGYFDIVPNVATALATLVPLEQAPMVTTLAALLCQMLVSAVVIFGNSPFWDSWPKKAIISLGIQLINPFEVWLTTISEHFWFCIATFFILLEEPAQDRPVARAFHRGMLLLAGLSSLVSVFLTPLYLLKAWRSRCRESWIQFGILVATGTLQGTVVLFNLFNSDLAANRFGRNDFQLDKVIELHFLNPFLTWQIAERVPEVLSMSVMAGIGFYVVFLAVRDIRSRQRRAITISFFLVAVFSTLSSINMASSPRYAFAPSVMLLVLFVQELFQRQKRVSRWLAGSILGVTLASCCLGFQCNIFYSPDFPQWRHEVVAWSSGQQHILNIWPQFESRSWRVNLDPVAKER